MSGLDYKFKEIPFDPCELAARFAAPSREDREEEACRQRRRECYVRSRMREVKKAMEEHLTARQSECLMLYYLEGCAQREIAERLGIHQTTVSQHVQYALKKLRRACEN